MISLGTGRLCGVRWGRGRCKRSRVRRCYGKASSGHCHGVREMFASHRVVQGKNYLCVNKSEILTVGLPLKITSFNDFLVFICHDGYKFLLLFY